MQQISVLSNLRFWPNVEYSNEQCVCATTLQLMHQIKSKFEGIKDKTCSCVLPRNSNSIIFLGISAHLNLKYFLVVNDKGLDVYLLNAYLAINYLVNT